MWLVTLGLLGFFGWMGVLIFRPSPAPTQIEPGKRVVEDAQDHGLTLFSILLEFLVAGLGLAGSWYLLPHAWAGSADARTLMAFTVLVGLSYLIHGTETLLTQWRERRTAAPGVLTVSEWPLSPGRTVRFQFERPLREPFALAGAAARLDLCERRRKRSQSGWKRMQSVDWELGEVSVRDGLLRSTWVADLAVFAPMAAPAPPFRWVPRVKRRWELRITVQGLAGEHLGSCFHLNYMDVPGEGQAPGAGAG